LRFGAPGLFLFHPHWHLSSLPQRAARFSTHHRARDVATLRLISRRLHPVILLGRLAVDSNHQGAGIGVGPLKDALQRVVQISGAVGSRALIVHGIDQNAMAFYFKYGFIEFPNGSQTLFLLIETIALGVS
jgi:GNAT superfamily N-acetyltransferase